MDSDVNGILGTIFEKSHNLIWAGEWSAKQNSLKSC